MLVDYPKPAVSADVVVFSVIDDQLQVLLIERSAEPFKGVWALPGGFVKIDESLEAAALRELEEETGVKDPYVEQLYTYGEPDRDPRGRVITVSYYALLPSDADFSSGGGSDAAQAKWHDVGKLPSLAFDHREIIDYAITRLRNKLEYTAVGFELLPNEFTLTEIQSVYEIVLNEKLDKRNFRRRILSSNIIEPTHQKKAGEGRPAQLYRYKEDAVAEIKARRLFP